MTDKERETRMTSNQPEPSDVSTEAAVHINALMDLFRQACRRQAWTLDEERSLVGWTDVTCSAGHEFAVRAWDVLSTRKPFGMDPNEPWCKKCRNVGWVAECLAVLKSVAKTEGIELTATDEQDESGDGHVVFAAKCSKGHHFKTTGAHARTWRREPVDTLCPDCRKTAAYAEGFAKVEAVVRETRSTVVKEYRNAVDVRCRRGHSHSFYVDSWDGRQAIRPDFCGTCNKLAKFEELSERAKDLGITVLESQWIAASRPHQAVCFAGHEFVLIPNKMKHGCPQCPPGMYGGAVPPHDVYYVVSGLDTATGEDTVKPGISSGGGYNRLRQHAEDGLTAQHLRITGLPIGMARALERFVLDGLDTEGWLSTRGVEYFPLAALHDVMDLVGEWFTDQPGLSSRPVVVDVDDVYDAVQAPAVHDVVDVDVDTAVIFDSDDVTANAASMC
ncbi:MULTISPECIES: hypothetical protein [unclassified Streptomyces]|uniref:hypothetical protein n=1 Tax=unclassified Streptomyces TaxID=2593676 RepID=UPI0023657559|nr:MULTISPECIES: hypothetical protein [unclassified Streptomyces]MDF3148110.1 hypothetical protein [Streptomyces sp. T21Q-yed]WDF43489.1 hypothetical protein PBV52_45275 [Streptomyces sp. T12]